MEQNARKPYPYGLSGVFLPAGWDLVRYWAPRRTQTFSEQRNAVFASCHIDFSPSIVDAAFKSLPPQLTTVPEHALFE
jgi:hypothetical protein